MGNSTSNEKFDLGEQIKAFDPTNLFHQNQFPATGVNVATAIAGKAKVESLGHAAFSGDLEFINNSKTCDAEEMDQDGNTPVHWACLKCRLDILKVLLNRRFLFNTQNRLGDTPLHFACSAGFAEGVKQLINAKADVWVRNKARATPLHFSIASERGDIMGQLRRADPEQFTAHVNDQTSKGDTALHWATAKV